MTERTTDETFASELRHLLHHLYDPGELAKSPLIELLALGRRSNPAAALRRALLAAIQTLKPEAAIPPHSNAWRLYHVLVWRYVEQSKQNEVAANLAISPRQLRRLEWASIQVLAEYLWARYDLEQAVESLEAQSVPLTPDRSQELKWLQESVPDEVADVADVLAAALKTVAPLCQAYQTRIKCGITENLPLVVGQVIALRQALMNLLTAAIHSSPGGQIAIAVGTHQQQVSVQMRTIGSLDSTSASGNEVQEHLDMARQFVELFGGTLKTEARGTDEQAFQAELCLSVADQTPVLFVDDNTDTLQLLQRYLTGTRYRFIGTSDPEQALALAEEQAPQIIVLDIMLPGIDGWELLGRLREHPALGRVPILVCTILPQDKLATTLGAAGFVRKPVSREALLAALNRQTSPQESRSVP